MDKRFTIIFVTVLGLTVLCGAIALVLAISGQGAVNPMLSELFKTTSTLFTAGVGAIFALLSAYNSS